jgi:hypothetical protein
MLQPDPGPIVLHSDIEAAVRDTLKEWVPYYLAEIDEAQGRDRGKTEAPRAWITRSEGDPWLEQTPPALLVHCAGTIDKPKKHGPSATYGAWWQVNIGITAGGATEQGSFDLAGRMAGAVLYVVTQQSDMGGLAGETLWGGSSIAPVPPHRTVMACECIAELWIAHVVDTRGDLPRVAPTPRSDPADPVPTPTSSRIRVERRA